MFVSTANCRNNIVLTICNTSFFHDDHGLEPTRRWTDVNGLCKITYANVFTMLRNALKPASILYIAYLLLTGQGFYTSQTAEYWSNHLNDCAISSLVSGLRMDDWACYSICSGAGARAKKRSTLSPQFVPQHARAHIASPHAFHDTTPSVAVAADACAGHHFCAIIVGPECVPSRYYSSARIN